MGNKLLVFIVFIAFALRFINIGALPPSLTWDEAAWGYNAYSLGIDGKDEFGRFLPLDYLESFGDFKPPVYAYLDILPVKLFGLTEFAVRFPSALFGVLTVFLTYFLTKRIFYNSNLKEQYALVATLIMAVSPWHIMLSRAAFEANVASFFIVLGIFLFIKSFQDKSNLIILSVVSFVISLYTFNTARIFSPLIFLVLLIIFRKDLLNLKKKLVVAFVVGVIMIIPSLGFLFSDQAKLRFKEVNIFSDVGIIELVNQEIQNDKEAFWSKIIHNRRFAYTVEYLRHYFDNLSPNFLFIKGDGNPKFSTQDVGQLYLWDLVFLVGGTLLLIKKKEGLWILLPMWLLLGIAPAATARETPHALRIETVLPTFQIIVAYGFVNLVKKTMHRRLLFAALALNVFYFLHGYYAHYPKEFSREWQYGYKDSISYVSSVEKDFDQINVTDELGRPYIYYLFYKKVSPEEFRETAIIKKDVFGFVNVEGFGKYRFGRDLNEISKTREDNLYVDLYNKVPSNAIKHKTIELLNGSPYLTIYSL